MMKSVPGPSPSDRRRGDSGIDRPFAQESDKDVSHRLLHPQRVTKSHGRPNPIPSSSTTGPRLVTARSSTQEPPSGNAKKLDVSWVQPLPSQTRQSKQHNRQPLSNISTNTHSGNAEKLDVSWVQPLPSQSLQHIKQEPDYSLSTTLKNTPLSTAKGFDISTVDPQLFEPQHSEQDNRRPLPYASMGVPSSNAAKLDVSWVQPLSSQHQRHPNQDNRQPLPNSSMSAPPSGSARSLGLSRIRPMISRPQRRPNSGTPSVNPMRLTPANGVAYHRETWASRTLLSHEFKKVFSRMELCQVARYFSQPRSEDTLEEFLEAIRPRFPPESGWIWPLLWQFRKFRGKTVVVILLHCPKYDATITTDSDDSCFTDVFVSAMEKCFEMQGIGVIKLDVRKQCLRTGRDDHCRIFKDNEVFILGMCTVIELLIATRVFGIQIHSTVAFSKTVVFPSGPLNVVQAWDPSLLGTVYRFPWHPRSLHSQVTRHILYPNAMFLVHDNLIPVISTIANDFQQGQNPLSQPRAILIEEYAQTFISYCQSSTIPSVRRVFVPPDDNEPDSDEPDSDEPDDGEPDDGEPDDGEPDDDEPAISHHLDEPSIVSDADVTRQYAEMCKLNHSGPSSSNSSVKVSGSGSGSGPNTNLVQRDTSWSTPSLVSAESPFPSPMVNTNTNLVQRDTSWNTTDPVAKLQESLAEIPPSMIASQLTASNSDKLCHYFDKLFSTAYDWGPFLDFVLQGADEVFLSSDFLADVELDRRNKKDYDRERRENLSDVDRKRKRDRNNQHKRERNAKRTQQEIDDDRTTHMIYLRKWRKELPPDKKRAANDKQNQRRRDQVANETPEEKEARCAKRRAKKHEAKAKMSPEELAAWKYWTNENAKVYKEERLGKMTPAELEEYQEHRKELSRNQHLKEKLARSGKE